MRVKITARPKTITRPPCGRAPNDYAGLVSMAKCQLIQKKYARGSALCPAGEIRLPPGSPGPPPERLRRAATEGVRFRLPGIPDRPAAAARQPPHPFLQGYAQEGMSRQPQAAREYRRYLQKVQKASTPSTPPSAASMGLCRDRPHEQGSDRRRRQSTARRRTGCRMILQADAETKQARLQRGRRRRPASRCRRIRISTTSCSGDRVQRLCRRELGAPPPVC